MMRSEFQGLPLSEAQQLESLIHDHGLSGAIRYLQPLTCDNPSRDQEMADRHRAILESICETRVVNFLSDSDRVPK